jgi:cytidylate kinase
MKNIVIAIDGYSACGKSTLARELAATLGYTYIDSGAMYRAITLGFMRGGVSLDDPGAVDAALKEMTLGWHPAPGGGGARMWLNGEDVETAIREIAVASRVSEVAALPRVREFAVACQRGLATGGGVVMDGRDVGTVVFPDAGLKIFMTASPEIRVERRYQEALSKHENVTREQIAENLAQRDYLDTHRAVGPLVQAPDAVVIDNSRLSREAQLARALALVRSVTEVAQH